MVRGCLTSILRGGRHPPHPDRKSIWHHVALAGVEQLDEMPRSVRVRDIVTESKSWSRTWFRPVPKATEDDVRDVCGEIYGARDLPPLDAGVSGLSTPDRLLLRISLALRPSHHGGDPEACHG